MVEGIYITPHTQERQPQPPNKITIAYDYALRGVSSSLGALASNVYPYAQVQILNSPTQIKNFANEDCLNCEDGLYLPPQTVEVPTILRLARSLISDQNQIQRFELALKKASEYHATAKRADGRAYFTGHLTPLSLGALVQAARARKLEIDGITDEFLTEALIRRLLHDSLEDCPTDMRMARTEELTNLFGVNVTNNILSLTKDYSIEDKHKRNEVHALKATASPTLFLAKIGDTTLNMNDDLIALTTDPNLDEWRLNKIKHATQKYTADYNPVFYNRWQEYQGNKLAPLINMAYSEYHMVANLAARAYESRMGHNNCVPTTTSVITGTIFC